MTLLILNLIVLGVAFLLMAIEEWCEKYVSISGLLAVMSMACAIKMKSDECVSKRIAEKYGKLWLAAEVLLFVLVGAAVDIRYTLKAGLGAIAIIFIALIFRSIGVWLCLVGTDLNVKEKWFCVISYLPKATVQAAIGSVPLSLGLPCGNIVLSVAVLSIIITAPIGAFAMDLSYKKLLEDENEMDVKLENKVNEDGTSGAPSLYANIPIVSINEEKKKESQEIAKSKQEEAKAEKEAEKAAEKAEKDKKKKVKKESSIKKIAEKKAKSDKTEKAEKEVKEKKTAVKKSTVKEKVAAKVEKKAKAADDKTKKTAEKKSTKKE